MQDGDPSGPPRLLTAEESILKPSLDTTEKLQSKHPKGDPVALAAPASEAARPSPITAKEIRAAINGFPNGSAGGPDGLRPGYYKELLASLRGVDAIRFCDQLAAIGDIMLGGNIPESIRAVLYGVNLFAFRKKDGGVRPIAVGMALRRLVARLVSKRLNYLGELMRPTQLGFATKGGAEATVHAARSFLESNAKNPRTRAFVKLDVKNAFNSLDRTKLLESVQQKMPEYYPLFYQSYGSPTVLLSGTDVILSERGVQQGDPIGPVGYCAATHDAHQDLKSELVIGFLDDDVIAGDVTDVISDIKSLRHSYALVGLELNVEKCELFLVGGDETSQRQERAHVLKEIGVMLVPSSSDLKYLGAPLTDDALEPTMIAHMETATRLITNVERLNAHTAIYLLTNCLGPIKVLYTLRTSRLYQRPDLLSAFDNVILWKLSSIVNNRIDRTAADQLTLPVSCAGLGIRRTEELALPAFLASAFSVHLLAAALGPFDPENYTALAMAQWQERTDAPIPEDPLKKVQKEWDGPLLKQKLERVKEAASHDPTSKARLLAVSTPEAYAWLRSYPAITLGTVLDDEAVRFAVALLLGLEVCKPHKCVCGQWADAFGHHALSCGKSAGRLKCHTALNETVARTLQSCGFHTELEPPGLSDLDGKRPDGQTLSPYRGGKRLAFDVTVVSTTAVSHIAQTSSVAGSAAAQAERHKIRHYEDLAPNYIFEPLGFETLGSWGPRAIAVVNDIGKRLQEATGDKRATEYFRQRLSIEIQRGNAHRVLGTMPEGEDMDEIFSVIRPMRKRFSD